MKLRQLEARNKMGMSDLILKAKATARVEQDGEFIGKDQSGTILIHSFEFYETTAGKWAAMKGEIASSRATVNGALVQPVGTRVRTVITCHGKFADMGYEKVYKIIKAVYDPSDDDELRQAMVACFGSNESGFTNMATEADRKHPLFGARGILVGFSSKDAKNNSERLAAGKQPIVNVNFTHVKQTSEEIAARRLKLAEAVG